MQRFGEKLRFLRTQRGMTVRDLAEALGYVNSGHISQLENGKREPTAKLVMKVAQLFNVSADQLLRDDLEVDTGVG